MGQRVRTTPHNEQSGPGRNIYGERVEEAGVGVEEARTQQRLRAFLLSYHSREQKYSNLQVNIYKLIIQVLILIINWTGSGITLEANLRTYP